MCLKTFPARNNLRQGNVGDVMYWLIGWRSAEPRSAQDWWTVSATALRRATISSGFAARVDTPAVLALSAASKSTSPTTLVWERAIAASRAAAISSASNSLRPVWLLPDSVQPGVRLRSRRC